MAKFFFGLMLGLLLAGYVVPYAAEGAGACERVIGDSFLTRKKESIPCPK